MKAIDLAVTNLTLPEALKLAGQDNLLLKTPDGREYLIAEIDEFAHEVALVRQHKELNQLLALRSKETKKHLLAEVRKRLKVR